MRRGLLPVVVVAVVCLSSVQAVARGWPQSRANFAWSIADLMNEIGTSDQMTSDFTFVEPGIYSVVLMVTDSGNPPWTDTKQLQVVARSADDGGGPVMVGTCGATGGAVLPMMAIGLLLAWRRCRR